MTKSLRRVRANPRVRDTRDDLRAKNHREAAAAISQFPEKPIREIASAHNISRDVAHKIKKATRENTDAALPKVLNPKENRAGRRPALSNEEHDIFVAGIRRFSIVGHAFGGFRWPRKFQ